MGSFATLSIDEFEIWSAQKVIDEVIMTIFRERDRAIMQCAVEDVEDEVESTFSYRVGRREMLDRLDVMGFTREAMLADFERCREIAYKDEKDLEENLADFYDRVEDPPIRGSQVFANLSFEGWTREFNHMRRLGLHYYDDAGDAPEGMPLVHLIMKWHDAFYGYCCSDFRFFLRATLEANPTFVEIVLDYTGLVHDGYYEEDQLIAEEISSQRSHLQSAAEPVLILTEGRTDIRVLERSLTLRYPHLADFYVFADFEEVRLDGGVDALCRLVRGFIAAKMRTRILALFDNDTAGTAGMRSLEKVPRPSNVALLQLPELPVARSYPTLGPNGPMMMDVNGLACGIEMYLGKNCLRTEDGNMVPIRWTGFNKSLQQYQGELLDKNGVMDRFNRVVDGDEPTGGAMDWSGLDLVFRDIFNAFRKVA